MHLLGMETAFETIESQACLPSKPCSDEGETTCTRVFTHACSNCLLQGHWKNPSDLLIAFKSKENTAENTGHWEGTHLRQSTAFLDRLRQFLAYFNTTEDWQKFGGEQSVLSPPFEEDEDHDFIAQTSLGRTVMHKVKER